MFDLKIPGHLKLWFLVCPDEQLSACTWSGSQNKCYSCSQLSQWIVFNLTSGNFSLRSVQALAQLFGSATEPGLLPGLCWFLTLPGGNYAHRALLRINLCLCSILHSHSDCSLMCYDTLQWETIAEPQYLESMSAQSKVYFCCSLFWSIAYVVSYWILFMDGNTDGLWEVT